MRTTVTLDDDVFAAAQALAQASGRGLGDVLSDLARRGLCVPVSTPRKNGLPVFEVPAYADVIPSDRAADLQAEVRSD